MAIAMPNPLLKRLAEALGLDPNRCRSIDLHLRTDDVVTVSAVEYVDEEQAERVVKVMKSVEYFLVPKSDIA
jgi:pyrroloquinoline quinone (PQQ) biosynthesis protein C